MDDISGGPDDNIVERLRFLSALMSPEPPEMSTQDRQGRMLTTFGPDQDFDAASLER